MPELDDPILIESGAIFGAACLALSWAMLGQGESIVFAAKLGGLLSLGFAVCFCGRALHRGALSGLPFWPQAPSRDGNELAMSRPVARAVDADVWFAQTMSGMATCLLTLAVILPMVGVA
ncbi:hypothetical protein ACKTEK_01085 [Tepidamorphus sp. 3E244]|uniref:hypothetical protein n=1 Tax=Tepidamorphus sp. 3E244 TaxID=3385498 RepID=UPI0038FC37FE